MLLWDLVPREGFGDFKRILIFSARVSALNLCIANSEFTIRQSFLSRNKRQFSTRAKFLLQLFPLLLLSIMHPYLSSLGP